MTDHPTAPVQDDDVEWLLHKADLLEAGDPRSASWAARLRSIASRLSPTPETEMVTLPQMLDESAARESESVAQHLEDLRNRLGKIGLSTDEWNALVGAAAHLRIDARRRSHRALSNVLSDEV